MPEIDGTFDFAAAAADLGVPLTAMQLEQFDAYLSLLLQWNQRINLTAVATPTAVRQRHFLDSLTCAAVISPENGRFLIDVGSGAGFPGLPLKILWPALHVTLVESVAKKARFLHAVVAELALSDVEIVTARAETLGQDAQHRARYDWAVARAVAPLPILVEYLLPLCRVGGRVVAQKGVQARDECAQAAAAIERLGGGVAQLQSVPDPSGAAQDVGYLVVIAKERETPRKYPRRVGIPAKRPLRR